MNTATPIVPGLAEVRIPVSANIGYTASISHPHFLPLIDHSPITDLMMNESNECDETESERMNPMTRLNDQTPNPDSFSSNTQTNNERGDALTLNRKPAMNFDRLINANDPLTPFTEQIEQTTKTKDTEPVTLRSAAYSKNCPSALYLPHTKADSSSASSHLSTIKAPHIESSAQSPANPATHPDSTPAPTIESTKTTITKPAISMFAANRKNGVRDFSSLNHSDMQELEQHSNLLTSGQLNILRTVQRKRELHPQRYRDDYLRHSAILLLTPGWSSALRYSMCSVPNSVNRSGQCKLHKFCPYFFQTQSPYLINCANGILNVVTREFKPFSHQFPIKDVLPVKYDPGAKPDLFLKSFLNHILSFDDIDFLQRFCGQLLSGRNHAQKILVLTGESGWGKSTLMKILCTMLGWERVGIVREQLFKDDMELGHYAGRHLLYGPDMNSQFLNRKESSLFKQLVGNDPIWAETKDSGRIIIEGHFPIVLACNTKPQIMLDHDSEAWARRLVVLEFKKPEHERHLGKLADILVQKELSGVLNWLLDGFAKLHSSGLQLNLTEEQQTRANLLLIGSESPQAFVQGCVIKKAEGEMGALELYEKYQEWCQSHRLQAFPSKEFHKMAKKELELRYGLRYRHDLIGEGGGVIRGWKGLALVKDANLKTGSIESGSQSEE